MRAKRAIIAAMRIVGTNVRLCFGKLLHGGRLRFSPVTCLAFSDSIYISRKSIIDFGCKLRTRGRCSFSSQEQGNLIFGHEVFLNSGCMFSSRHSIIVGDGCEFGPNVLVYDHDHQFDQGLKKDAFRCAPVKIGDNCWIGAGTVILRGTRLGDGCVVGAGCVLKGEFPPNSVVVQKRCTEIRSLIGRSEIR